MYSLGWRSVVCLLFAPVLVFGQSTNLLEDNGGHFRFANIRWQRLTGNNVQFTLESAWRRDYGSTFWQGSGPDNLTITGDVISLNGRQWPVLSFGDDIMMVGEYLKLNVEAYSVSEDWVYGTTVVTHRYATINNKGAPWVVSFTGCCKISPVNDLDSKDMPWEIISLVDLSLNDASPRILAMPVYSILNSNITHIRWEREDASEFPLTQVSFYVPGFHPSGHVDVKLDFADAAVWDNHAALYQTVTPFDVSIDSHTGKISMHFPAVSLAESAQSTWSLPGVEQLGMFYFIKLNASIPGIVVQCDFLLRLELRNVLMPRIAFGTLDANLPETPALDQLLAPLQLPPEKPRFYPNASYHVYAGFAVGYTLAAYVAQNSSRPRALVGFGVHGLPRGAHLSAVKGTNPTSMAFSWIPCADQLGQQITCYEAVESTGNASAPECVNVMIYPDPRPLFYLARDETRGDNFPPSIENMTNQTVLVTLGAVKVYTVTAYDINCQDSLNISVLGTLPPGAVLSSQQNMTNPATDLQCQYPSASSAVNRTLTWNAPYNYGGTVLTICFSVIDSCGGCSCAGQLQSTVQCVTFQVIKCRYSVGAQHQLSEVAYIYNTNWLQLWKMNPDLLHPDYVLFKGQSIDIGRLVIVGSSDTLSGLAARYGSSIQSIYDLNHDLNGTAQLIRGNEICIIPNSCQGQSSGEAAQGGISLPERSLPQGAAYASQATPPLSVFRCSSSSNTQGVLYSSQLSCTSQCLNSDGSLGICTPVGSPPSS